MNEQTRREVRLRANNRCEYCGRHQDDSPLARLQIEHIIPKKHGGSSVSENLARACIDCNLKKSSDLAGLDPATGLLTRLFDPRTQNWTDHFRWDGIFIVGLSDVGRTTARVLDLNSEDRLVSRIAIQD